MNARKEQLDTLIDRSNIPMKEIAKRMDVDYSTFWRYRQNPEKMRVGQVIRLAEIIGVNKDAILKIIGKYAWLKYENIIEYVYRQVIEREW